MNLNNQNLSEVAHELLTLRDYIRFGYSRFNAAHLFYGQGTDNAWDEALQLVLTALHLPPDISKEMLDAKLTMVERRYVCDLILQRINDRIPVAYLVKEAWFAGLPFYVDQRVIIPRSPIAELIEKEFSPWLGDKDPQRILDLCTGSGCIAIACALTFPESQVDAVDISEDALAVASININKYHLADQVNLIRSDLFESVKQQYDIIVSNPPYVSEEEYASLPKEYTHEPILALKAKNGIEIIKSILKNALKFLLPTGLLIVEAGNSQSILIEQFPDVPFLWLDFERGGEGVFMLTYDQLQTYQPIFQMN